MRSHSKDTDEGRTNKLLRKYDFEYVNQKSVTYIVALYTVLIIKTRHYFTIYQRTLKIWLIKPKTRKKLHRIIYANSTHFVWSRGDDSSLPVCSVSFTVHLQLFTNNDGQNQLIINKYAVCSRYSSWPIQLVKD